jgi:hypothetical protein
MDDYETAATRHLSDAEHLRQSTRLDNADQLYGLSAECALKVALVRAGVVLTTTPGLRKHVDSLWDLAGIHLRGRHVAAVAAVLKLPNPFADWSVNQRYYTSGHVAEPVLLPHRKAAVRLLGSIGVVASRASE